jgi:SAM-dependent methyltransferase
LFEKRGDVLVVKPWVREGIRWQVGDAGDAKLAQALGPHDIVLANNFLCHMDGARAESCLRNIAGLVSPHGHLFVTGIDLDVRTKVALDLGFSPVQDLLEEIHEGDPWLRSYWPCHYSGLEPLSRNRRDWRTRYAAAFEVVPPGAAALAANVKQSGAA